MLSDRKTIWPGTHAFLLRQPATRDCFILLAIPIILDKMNCGWLRKKELWIGVAGNLLAAALLYGLTFVPNLRPSLTSSVSLPVWLTLSIVIAVGAVTLSYFRRLRRERSRSNMLEGELCLYKQDCYKFYLYDLEWEISGDFIQNYRSEGVPENYHDIVRGPFCSKCKTLLKRRENEVHGDEVMTLEHLINPCPKCKGLKILVPTSDVYRLKHQVYEEAQRLARHGEFPKNN